MSEFSVMLLISAGLLLILAGPSAAWEGFRDSPHFGERVHEMRIEPGVRVQINAPGPAQFDPAKSSRLILYALPNGNTIEQTIGCAPAEGLDWHFNIQHIGAQTRLLRTVCDTENVFVAYLEAEGLSWPRWRQQHAGEEGVYGRIVREVAARIPASPLRLTLTGHSGGGSFDFGLLNESETIPDEIDRIALLDSNYSYDDDTYRHGDKLLEWLRRDSNHHLILMAYDDRNVTFQGKPIVSATGGTYRATGRMIARLEQTVTVESGTEGDFETHEAIGGQFRAYVHTNPHNKILHTALVGDMNGYLHAMTVGTPAEEQWGELGGPVAYSELIQPPPGTDTEPGQPQIPARSQDAAGGHAFMESIADLDRAAREAAILRELSTGNLPDFLRGFVAVTVKGTDTDGAPHEVQMQVMPDYLSVGSDADFVRVPMTPQTARALADQFACSLPTRKMVDDTDARATVRLAPRPLTQEREAVATFTRHHEIIEGQFEGHTRGELVCGIKKDIVLSNRIGERPNRLALYGWRKLDGAPIQPLTTVHVDWYVDYSHGARLIAERVLVDGKAWAIEELLADATLWPLLSDEGPITPGWYRKP